MKLIQNSLISLFFITLFSISLYAQPPSFQKVEDPALFRAKLKETSKNIKTLESDFTQEKHLDILSENAISKGHFYYKKENMLRWEYSEPFRNIMILNNGRITIKDEDQVVKRDAKANRMFKKIYEIISGCISGEILNNDNFDAFLFENAKTYLVELVPNLSVIKKNIKKINIYFNRENHTVFKIIITEPSDDYTSIVFYNQKVNIDLPDERFEIK